jgi:DNA-binding protein Fis
MEPDEISERQQLHAILCELTWPELQKLQMDVILDLYGGNKSHAARHLGISVRTVRNRVNNGKKETENS